MAHQHPERPARSSAPTTSQELRDAARVLEQAALFSTSAQGKRTSFEGAALLRAAADKAAITEESEPWRAAGRKAWAEVFNTSTRTEDPLLARAGTAIANAKALLAQTAFRDARAEGGAAAASPDHA